MRTISIGKVADLLSLWPLLVNTLAALAIVVVAVTDGAPAAVIAPLVPLAVIIWRQRRALVRPSGLGAAGRYHAARLLLIGAATVDLHADGRLDVLGAAASVLTIAALALEPLLHSLHGMAVPYAAHVPGHEARDEVPPSCGWIFPLNLLALLVLLVVGPAPRVLLLVVIGLSLIPIGIALAGMLDAARRIRERRRFQADLPQVLESMAPVFYVYWNAPARSAFQVTMWLPHLERMGVPFAIVVRTVGNFRQLQHVTEHPVILRRSLTDLDDLIVPSVRGVFYVNNAMRNNHMVRYSQLTHIQLLHGESDKASSATPIIRMYDRDFVAGQAAIDRFDTFGVHMPPGIFRIVGRPQVEDVEPERAPIAEIAEPSVLYAPTWLGYQAETNYSSLQVGPALVRGLLERGCRVVFRPHPYASRSPELQAACEEIRQLLAEDAAATGREHLHGELAETEMSVVDCFNASDAMISDVSAVVGDHLHSGKPLAMVSPRTGAEEFVEQFPMARAAYVLVARDGELENLDEVLDALTRTDPRGEERRRWATYYLGDIPRETYAQRFVDTAREELGLGEEGPATRGRAASPELGRRGDAS